jgi:circadian clock protein KaiB
MEQFSFILYVAGDGELSARAQANFDRLIRSRLRERCSLSIVDILRDPREARRSRVVATPLLVKERPAPIVKILGDLSQEERILVQLGLGGMSAEVDPQDGPDDGLLPGEKQ